MAFPYRTLLERFTSFNGGFKLLIGSEVGDFASQMMSAKAGITAFAGGGQASATQLVAALNRVETVATAADSVKLPLAVPGAQVTVTNATATSMQVFGQAVNAVTGVGDTIAAQGTAAPVATGTGVAQAAGVTCIYSCITAGVWQQGSIT